jgi:hypothetical protein
MVQNIWGEDKAAETESVEKWIGGAERRSRKTWLDWCWILVRGLDVREERLVLWDNVWSVWLIEGWGMVADNVEYVIYIAEKWWHELAVRAEALLTYRENGNIDWEKERGAILYEKVDILVGIRTARGLLQTAIPIACLTEAVCATERVVTFREKRPDLIVRVCSNVLQKKTWVKILKAGDALTVTNEKLWDVSYTIK